MQEVVIRVDWSCEKSKKKAIKIVSEDEDVRSFSVDEENKQLTVNGDMDPVSLVKKIRKKFPGPAAQIVYMQTETPRVAVPQPQVPHPPHGHPHHPDPYNWGPFYPANGPPHHPDPYNWPPSAPPYGVYCGHYGPQ